MNNFLTILILFFSLNAYAHENHEYGNDVLKIYSEEDFAPFNYYNKDGVFDGASIVLTKKILETANFKHTNIKNIPWARAYYLTKHQPNTLLFSMYRTPLRENLFDWVGPIGSSQIILLAKKGHKFKEDSAIAASIRSSASLQTLEKTGFPDERIIKLNDTKLGIKLLNLGRIDIWAISLISAQQEIKRLNLDFNDYYIYKTLAERDIYFGFNKDTDPSIKNFFAEKLDELKKSGEFKKIMKMYNL